jgi:tetratricopeptide (TPR) repeat protein
VTGVAERSLVGTATSAIAMSETAMSESAMSETAQSLYLQALRKHRARDYAGAIALLEQALQLDPALGDAWEALGVLHEKCERLDDAIRAMERLRDLQPDSIMAHTNLSRFYMKKGWTERAEEAQGRARLLSWKQDLASGAPAGDLAPVAGASPAAAPLEISSLLPDAAAARAAPGPELDREAVARRIAQFEAVLTANPGDAMARLTLGKAYLQAERAEDAIRVLEEALALQADYTAAYRVLGEAYERAGKLARAIKSYKRGIEIAEQKGDLHPRNEMQQRLAKLQGSPSS